MTLKASDIGIKLIEESINRIETLEGWGKQSPKWTIKALEIIEKENSRYDSKSSNRTGISLPTWNRFRNGKKVNAIAFKVFCKVLNLDWEEVAQLEPNEPTPNSFSYISACGLNKPPEKRNVFNDYSGDRTIDQLWADPLAEKKGGIAAYIKVKVVSSNPSNNNDNFLRINFVRQGWGVNLTIRPDNDTPVNAYDYQCIKFKIRSPEKDTVGLRVRIVDADYVFWCYGEYSSYAFEDLSTSSDDWKNLIIPLKTKNGFILAMTVYHQKDINSNLI